jgi:hypothetical protein
MYAASAGSVFLSKPYVNFELVPYASYLASEKSHVICRLLLSRQFEQLEETYLAPQQLARSLAAFLHVLLLLRIGYTVFCLSQDVIKVLTGPSAI